MKLTIRKAHQVHLALTAMLAGFPDVAGKRTVAGQVLKRGKAGVITARNIKALADEIAPREMAIAAERQRLGELERADNAEAKELQGARAEELLKYIQDANAEEVEVPLVPLASSELDLDECLSAEAAQALAVLDGVVIDLAEYLLAEDAKETRAA